jgi:acylphosphatase
MNVRRTVHFSGRVQGVGFRFTAQRLSSRFDVRGHVKNLPDGRVEVVAEGAPDEIDRFVRAIHVQMGDLIRDLQSVESPATNQYQSFDIAF